jgi:serine/threonine-protein kinase
MLILSPRLRALGRAERDRYESIAETYEALLNGALPDLEPFLPAEQPLRTLVLVHLARCDLEQRKKRGMPVRVEDYVTRFPSELAGDDDACLELVVWERQYDGEDDAQAWAARFPNLAARLRDLLPRLRPADVLPRVAGYEILGVLGRGGMGVVYKARHTQLQRLVALKLLRRGAHPTTDGADRFRREARVVAALRHPHIVDVYDYAGDSEPHLAMMLCPGGSLAERVKPMAPRPAAELVAALTGAVAHAHARAIIHRDLKPANVLFDSEGNPRVSDFGLVKQLGPDAREPSLTQTGAIVGTPSYMAPEQARGLTEVGPAADVYALGAILYEMLTGRPPFRAATTFETLEQVIHSEPASPRSLNPDVPRDLETICLKCLEKEPRRRYPSAGELAEDLHRYRQGWPIKARPPGLVERGGKWLWRNWVATIVMLLLVTLTVSLAVGLAAVDAERQRTKQANTETETALGRSRESEKSAAEQRQLSLATVRRVVDKIQARLKDEPRQQELRKELLAEAEAGLKEVARAVDTSAAADHETIWVLLELGDIFRDLEAGGLLQARRQYEKAHEVAWRLAEADPADAHAQRDLAVCLSSLGDTYRSEGKSEEALKWYQEALGIHRKLERAAPDDEKARQDLSVSLDLLGSLRRERGERKAALECYEEALAIDRKQAAAEPTNPQAQRAVAVSLMNLGALLLEDGKGEEALKHYGEAVVIIRNLARGAPTNVRFQQDLSAFLDRLGSLHRKRGEMEAALKCYEEALGIDRKLADDDPNNAQLQRGLNVSLGHVAEVRLEQGDVGEALKLRKEALESRRKLAKGAPPTARDRRQLAVSLGLVGDVLWEMGDRKGALEHHEQALEVFRERAEADRTNVLPQRDLVISYSKFGGLEQKAGELARAAGSYEKGIAVIDGFANPKALGEERQALEALLRVCRAAEGALDDPALALKQPEDLRLPVLAAVAMTLAAQKKADKAFAAAELLAANASEVADLYAAACCYAACVSLSETAEGKEERAARAVELLRKAIEKGFDARQAKREAALESLRQRDDFKALLANPAQR